MNTSTLRGILIVVAAAAVLVSCGQDNLTRVNRPPLVTSFSPETGTLDAFLGDTLTFRIESRDPDQQTIRSGFTLDGVPVAFGTRWSYVVDDTGYVLIRAFVTDGSSESDVEWGLRRSVPINNPPQIEEVAPTEREPIMVIDTQLQFAMQASDIDGDELFFEFYVDGQLVSTEANFLYTATITGNKVVAGIVSDGDEVATHQWDLRVTGVPDAIPPAEVPIVNVETGVEPGEINVSWIAVGEDGNVGTASEYFVRTSPVPILSEIDWAQASDRPNVPEPLPAGEQMSLVVSGLEPARFTHLAVRAVDDFGNLSPLGESPSGFTRGMRLTGRVFDAETGLPLPDAMVSIAQYSQTTDSDGEFVFIEMPRLVNTSLKVIDDVSPTGVGAYYDFHSTYTVKHLDDLDLYLIPNLPLTTTLYPDYLTFHREMTRNLGIPYPEAQRRWTLPIDVYVPEFVWQGLDYRAVIVGAMDEIETTLGMDAFNLVSSATASGVNIVYRNDILVDNFVVTDWTTDWYPQRAEIRFRTTYDFDDGFALSRVAYHEFGHVFGLNHSDDPNHMMVGGIFPSVSEFTDDELAIIRIRYNLPRGLSIPKYQQN